MNGHLNRCLRTAESDAMNSRERVLAAIDHQPLDRVPTDIWATPEVFAKLHAHFGADADLNALFHIDGMGYAGPEYVGPPAPEMPEGHSVDAVWGMRSKRVEYETGVYYEMYHWPLAEATTIDELARWRWPSADWFDFSAMPARLKAARETQATQCGYMAPFYYHNLTRGLETSLMDPYDDPDFTHYLLGRISDFFYEYHYRMFETCAGLIDVTQVTDDLGSQTGPLLSLETWREFYKPHVQRMIDLAKAFGIRVFHHDDGAMRAFLPDLIAMGIDILNPVQHNCPGMELEGLKRDFGGQICFHGAIDNQEILPFGTPEQVRAEVRAAIDILAGDGTGYILAPCHNLQAVTPVENIIAMFDEAWEYGKL
jgi:uroporphyrinogen decarboxylase